MVAFAINFAAEPEGNDNPALYAMKGLFGFYPGRFTVMPYYRKVREYNDIESRDIWEYPLNLTEQEVERVLLHLWEMQLAEFDYYFLDENCSYQLLALLELARDDLFSGRLSFSSHSIRYRQRLSQTRLD
ncbi:Lnb N-terminal periplasmic domain-containing protein [Vibrio metschnikovii]